MGKKGRLSDNEISVEKLEKHERQLWAKQEIGGSL